MNVGSEKYDIPLNNNVEEMYDLMVVQCLNDSDVISASYELRLFQTEILKNYTLKAHKLISVTLNRLVQDVQIVKSVLAKDDLYLVVLTIDRMAYDTMIYLIGMNWTEELDDKSHELYNIKDDILNWTLTGYHTFSGLNLKLDQFVVYSFMFLPGEPLIAVSVNNFGLIIIDIVTKSIADTVWFQWLIPQLTGNFTILNIIPINSNGIRVFIEDRGEFSIFWKKIGKIGDKNHIFIGFRIKNIFKTFDNEETTNLVDYSHVGYSQVVFYKQKDTEFNDAFVRVYSNYNHEHSNPLREFRIGEVLSWTSISQSTTLNKIVLVCGTKIYVIFITLYPSIYISKGSNTYMKNYLLESYNSNSKQRIELNYKNTIIDSKIPGWVVLLIFMLIIFLFSWLIYQIQDKTSKKNENKQNEVEKEGKESN